jgi:TatD DNase family protein
MQLFDTHAHIGLIHEDQMEQLLIVQLAKRKSVAHIVSICNSLHDFEQVYENLRTATGVYHAVGVSPSEVSNPGLNWEHKLQTFAKWERVVAIGEIGLDYYRNFGDKNSQVELFIRQLDIARSLQLPVIIHNREAGRDILDILKTRLGSREAYSIVTRRTGCSRWKHLSFRCSSRSPGTSPTRMSGICTRLSRTCRSTGSH